LNGFTVLTIYYDGDCPFCTAYTRLVRLREVVGEVAVVNVRDVPAVRYRLTGMGLELDKGMVVEYQGKTWHGAEAMSLLGRLTQRQGIFNCLNSLLFGPAWISALIYPLLRMGRNLVLLLLGRTPLRAGDSANGDLFRLFSVAWGIFSCLHFIIYGAQYGAPLFPSTWLILVFGFGLVLAPGSVRLFVLLVVVMSVDAVLQMPVHSNHTIIKNFWLLALLVGGLGHGLAGNSFGRFFGDVVPVGRALLAIMYVFGVWHKINSDFLNPEVSCAKALWDELPVFLSVFDHVAVYYAGIYGTLIIETLILGFLLVPRTRWLGIIAGVLFHSLLALSQYAFYPTFSMLTVALHLLYLSPGAATRIVKSYSWAKFMAIPLWQRGAMLGAWVGTLYWMAYYGMYTLGAFLWLGGMGWLLRELCLSARDHDARTWQDMLLSRQGWINVVTLLFFFNCITPYLGLKTAQSINMFANLRLEGGVSNHLLLRSPPGPFGYLEDIVEIRDENPQGAFHQIQTEGLRMVYYELLGELADNPGHSVSFVRNGVFYENQNSETLKEDIERFLHPRWFRKWFHFNPVDIRDPKPCALDR